jgi:hypothetical protein
MYFATVAWDTSIPSFRSSPWIRGAPHRGFASDIVRIRVRTSGGTVGRPTRRRLFHVQNRRMPWRCQAMTVSGLTMTSAARHSFHTRENHTHSCADAPRSVHEELIAHVLPRQATVLTADELIIACRQV